MAPPSTSAPPRSSPTSSTSPAASRSTPRRSRTRRCATARTSSAASPRRRPRAAPSSPPRLASGIDQCLGALYARQGISPRHLYDMTVVGNTAMHHLALGLPAQGLGAAPYAPVAAEPVTVRGADLGIDMNPEGGVHFPPPIAGFVGSDALAVIAATRLASKPRPSHRHRHRHEHRDRARARRPGHGHELRLGAGVRGLPDRPRHEGGRRRHREGAPRQGRASGRHRHHRRRAADRHLRLRRGRPARRARPQRRGRPQRTHEGAPARAQGRDGRVGVRA